MIPSQFLLFGLQIKTFGFFIFFGLVLFFFSLWKEAKNDGFNTNKIFDLALMSLVFSIFTSRMFFALNSNLGLTGILLHIVKFWEGGFSVYGALIGFLTCVYVVTKKWEWSIYRILDIFVLGISFGSSIVMLGFVGLQSRFEFLFGFAAWMFLYVLLINIRTTKIKSGYVFSLFLSANSLLGLIFFRDVKYLPFYLVLATLALVVFIFRWRLTSYETPKFIRTAIERIKTKIARKKKSN